MQIDKLHWVGLGTWCGIVAAAVVACGGGGGSGTVAPTQATMRVSLTDAPGCGMVHVWVTVEKIRVHTSSTAQDGDAGWSELALSPARRIDLLGLTNGVLEELGSMPLPAGHYSQVRLVLSADAASANPPVNAVQPTGGQVVALTTPSGQQSGVKLAANVDVAAGQLVDLVLDFDACSSVVHAGNSGRYLLKPVVSVVPRTVTGITGSVTSTLTMSSTTISAQQDGAVVRSTMPDATGKFAIPYLAPGTYTLVITSDAHATGVVTSVPAGSTTTVVSPTAIELAPSTMANVTGTVTASTLSGGTTVTTVITDATIRATQALTGGPDIEVARTPVAATLGTYSLSLPMAAPAKAAYTGSALTFSPDASVAGKFTIESQAPGRSTMTKPADVSSSKTTQDNNAN